MIAADRYSSSPNYTNAPVSALGIVIHATRSGESMNPSEFEGTLSWFANPNSGVSSHWLIGRDGTKCRVVPDTCWAWHASNLNDTHFGIELEQGVERDGFTPPQIDALVMVCRAYSDDYGIAPVYVASEFTSGYLGHEDTVQGIAQGKSDPGSGFDWSAFTAQLQGAPYSDLDVVPGREGLHRVGAALVLYNGGVPIWRYGGASPGATAKNYGGQWIWLRNDGRGGAYWSPEEGD